MSNVSPVEQPAWMRAAVRQYEQPLIRFATRIIGDSDRARDVVQDTFLRLWQADRNKVENRIPQWLFTVCRNRALDLRRRDARLDLFQKKERAASRPQPRADEMLERREAIDRAMAALEDLPQKQATVVRLKFREGMSYREISDQTGIPENSIGPTLTRAREKMRREGADSALN